MKIQKKRELEQKRRWRIRKKVAGTLVRPRLSLHFSNKHIYAQAINDDEGKTLLFVSTVAKELREQNLKANNDGASALGKSFGEKAKDSGISKVVFDRNGRKYHGCVKTFADAAREAGLKF
ncbi:MAG TPA: 50S ribosomal protein L18 [Opitutae bacterium]|nr:50S ribosomal protein L18 [Opitutae bacterium]|tara:strand:- start:1449 stop:1811 length:363 start_codon:yes stop_codon:yes gene_type:complete